MLKLLFLALSLAALPLATAATPSSADIYKDLLIQAKTENTVSVIVTLAMIKSSQDILTNLRSGDNRPKSYVAAQKAFMRKLGTDGIQAFGFFRETPSIALKLDHAALQRLLEIKDVGNLVLAPDTPILFDN